jgi:hypothetical protein
LAVILQVSWPHLAGDDAGAPFRAAAARVADFTARSAGAAMALLGLVVDLKDIVVADLKRASDVS